MDEVKWREHHKNSLAISEISKCIHCAASRLLELPETNPHTPAQKRRMTLGEKAEEWERERLKQANLEFYDGRQIVLEGYPIRVVGTPDFVIRENGGYRIIEVKYRRNPPVSIPREWAFQLGGYSKRYGGAPATIACYNGDGEREEMELEVPVAGLEETLAEWTSALRLVLDGKLQPNDLPHEPVWCKLSEWACPDCIGARQTPAELTALEEGRLRDFLRLEGQLAPLAQVEKEHKAAEEAAKEIVAAHGGELSFDGFHLRLKETSSERIDTKLIPPEEKKMLPMQTVVTRRLYLEKEA